MGETHATQPLQLIRGFYALRHQVQPEGGSNGGGGLAKCQSGGLPPHLAHGFGADLQAGQRGVGKSPEAETGAVEVSHDKAYPQSAEQKQSLPVALCRGYCVLIADSEFQGGAMRIYAPAFEARQRLPCFIDETAVVQLPRGYVDREAQLGYPVVQPVSELAAGGVKHPGAERAGQVIVFGFIENASCLCRGATVQQGFNPRDAWRLAGQIELRLVAHSHSARFKEFLDG